MKLTIPEKVEIFVSLKIMFVPLERLLKYLIVDIPIVFHYVIHNKKFEQTGTIAKPTVKLTKRHLIDNIIPGFGNPRTSVREIARELNLLKNKIWRCLRRHKLKPFQPKFLHTQEGDPERRLEYCYWLQGIFLKDRRFIDKILLSGETTFTKL